MPKVFKGNGHVFVSIYKRNHWEDPEFHSGGGSGGGSNPRYCRKFLKWIAKYIKERKISSILDLGVGDFRVGKHYYKEVTDYYGVDVVDKIPPGFKDVRFLKTDFSTPKNLRSVFQWSGSVDLVILKDVLMHWTDDEIKRFLKTLIKLPWDRCVTTNRWRYVRKPELNGTPRNPRANKYSSSPLPHNHPSLQALGLVPVLYYPSKNSIQVCCCDNPNRRRAHVSPGTT